MSYGKQNWNKNYHFNVRNSKESIHEGQRIFLKSIQKPLSQNFNALDQRRVFISVASKRRYCRQQHRL